MSCDVPSTDLKPISGTFKLLCSLSTTQSFPLKRVILFSEVLKELYGGQNSCILYIKLSRNIFIREAQTQQLINCVDQRKRQYPDKFSLYIYQTYSVCMGLSYTYHICILCLYLYGQYTFDLIIQCSFISFKYTYNFIY